MNQYFYSWNDIMLASLQDLWIRFANFVPALISALLVLILGLILASIFGNVARRIVKTVKIDTLSEKVGLTKMFAEAGLKFTFSGLVGWVAKWFFIVAILITVADILGWNQITGFLNSVALYIPNVFVAIIILAISMIAARFVQGIIEQAAKSSKHFSASQSKTLSSIAKWAIIIFGLLASLSQLGIATRLIEILFTGVVAALALSFGLGGKEKASQWIDKIDKSDD